MRILVNDGIDLNGKRILEEAGFELVLEKVDQDDLIHQLNNFDAITVRSATQVRKEHIDASPNLKLIGRGGVGMDNIDVEYARSKGIVVVNTPAASSLSVGELVFAHFFNGVRFLYDSNRQMPGQGGAAFSSLKKKYGKGAELRGKTLGVVGFGRIGRETAKIGLGLGMDVLYSDLFDGPESLNLSFTGGFTLDLPVKQVPFETLIKEANFISLHVPATDKALIGAAEFSQMKDGVAIVNASRGGVVDEPALIEALDSGKVSFAGLDVYENEPKPREEVLKHPKISLTPHIGAATAEAQERIGIELANLIIQNLQSKG